MNSKKLHNWVFEERGVAPGDARVAGTWHRCDGCGVRKFVGDNDSDFQKRLGDIFAFINLAKNAPEHLRKKLENPKKGLHALMAKDCVLAAVVGLFDVMQS